MAAGQVHSDSHQVPVSSDLSAAVPTEVVSAGAGSGPGARDNPGLAAVVPPVHPVALPTTSSNHHSQPSCPTSAQKSARPSGQISGQTVVHGGGQISELGRKSLLSDHPDAALTVQGGSGIDSVAAAIAVEVHGGGSVDPVAAVVAVEVHGGGGVDSASVAVHGGGNPVGDDFDSAAAAAAAASTPPSVDSDAPLDASSSQCSRVLPPPVHSDVLLNLSSSQCSGIHIPHPAAVAVLLVLYSALSAFFRASCSLHSVLLLVLPFLYTKCFS